ncbi:MAG: four-carbon acid sugar kinase family protein [Dehalococcoidales bacterium]|nr:four-carbon acid sugar kinase family protein [Dehalococcoidales bacterium]
MADFIRGFGIIADDITGAMDAGAGFLGVGLDPLITFGTKPSPDPRVIVVSTDSRDNDPETAHRKARRQARKLAGRYVYKKIDSTLRGNIGSELTAVMGALGFSKAVVCPAFPANERSVVGGNLMIGGVPLSETRFAKEADYPIRESCIPTLLHQQTGLPIGIIKLEEINRGPDNVFEKIRNSEQRIIVADASQEKHLRCIAQALFRGGDGWLPCGSGGLARELPPVFGYKAKGDKPFQLEVTSKPALTVVGSRNSASMEQMKTAEMSLSLGVVSIEPDKSIDSQGKLTGLRRLRDEVADFMYEGKSVLITTSRSRYMPDLKESNARLLARIAAGTVKSRELAGLFLTGGDTARETCRALGASGIRILKEIEQGVILGEAMGTAKGDVRIITKAGGFGRDNTIVKAIDYLRGEVG